MRNLIFVEIITGKIRHDLPDWHIARRTNTVVRKIRRGNPCKKTEGASSDRVILSCNFAKICSKNPTVKDCRDVWRQWVGGVVFGCDVTLNPGAAFITPVKRPHCRDNFYLASICFEQTALRFIRCIEHKVWFDENQVVRIRMNLHPKRWFMNFMFTVPCSINIYYNKPRRCNWSRSILFYFTAGSLYMFRVLSTPIIRSTYTVTTASRTGHISLQLPSSNVTIGHVGGK